LRRHYLHNDLQGWDASKKDPVVIGSSTDVPDRAILHMHALTFSRDNAAGLHVRSIAVHYSDPVTAIVAVTGATYPCDPDNREAVIATTSSVTCAFRIARS